MKTTFDAIDIVFGILEGSALDIAISGNINKLSRPLGSQVEDVVINSLPITGDMVQRATVNVNIYAPDLDLNIGGQRQFQPDYARLKALADIAKTVLKDHHSGTYNLWTGNQAILPEAEANQHFINIRIEFQNINFSYYE